MGTEDLNVRQADHIAAIDEHNRYLIVFWQVVCNG